MILSEPNKSADQVDKTALKYSDPQSTKVYCDCRIAKNTKSRFTTQYPKQNVMNYFQCFRAPSKLLLIIVRSLQTKRDLLINPKTH